MAGEQDAFEDRVKEWRKLPCLTDAQVQRCLIFANVLINDLHAALRAKESA